MINGSVRKTSFLLFERIERMSNDSNGKTHAVRKRIKPIIDDDDERRDMSGRKRVDVVDCLIESSSDESDDTKSNGSISNPILWLTFSEICHIRSVLAQTVLSSRMMDTQNKQYFKFLHDDLCFQCQAKLSKSVLISTIFHSKHYSICFVCQQKICMNCSRRNFLPPSPRHVFPVRTQTLIKLPSYVSSIENENYKTNESHPKAKTICRDCSQIFAEFRQTAQYSTQASITDRHQSILAFYLPFNLLQHTSDSPFSRTRDNSTIFTSRF